MAKRNRQQTGCVVQRKRGGKLVWLGIYRDAEGKQRITEPLAVKTKSAAKTELVKLLEPINQQKTAEHNKRDFTLALYIQQHYIPFGKGKWKKSTEGDVTARLNRIIEHEIGGTRLADLTRERMQAFLDGNAQYSNSYVSHLRFDLRAILNLAMSDGIVTSNQALNLYTPRVSIIKPVDKRSLSAQQVQTFLSVLGIRERLFCRFAIVGGMRPGEISALKWSDFTGRVVRVTRRVYRGVLDTTKTGENRDVVLGDSIISELRIWRQMIPESSEWVFPSENATPIWYPNIWRRDIQPVLKKVKLDWADFQAMRRTNANLMRQAGADEKASADLRGHDVGVSTNEYQRASVEEMTEAISKLEQLLAA